MMMNSKDTGYTCKIKDKAQERMSSLHTQLRQSTKKKKKKKKK